MNIFLQSITPLIYDTFNRLLILEQEVFFEIKKN